jgi:CrcB protein
MLGYIWVSVGSAAGGAARFWISGLIAARYGQTFPFGTLAVNVTGSFIVGLLAALAVPEGRWLMSPSMRELLMIGFCGGYTTFSSFSLQTFALLQGGEWWRAAANAIASFALCLVAVWLGHFAISAINKS